MKVALVFKTGIAEKLKEKLIGIKDNLDMDCYDDVSKMVQLSMKRNFIYDRVIIVDNLLDTQSMQKLRKWWGSVSSQTEIVILARKGDNTIIDEFTELFVSPMIAIMFVDRPTVKIVEDAVKMSTSEINSQHGDGDLVKFEVEKDGYDAEAEAKKAEEERQKKLEEQKKKQAELEKKRQEEKAKKKDKGGFLGGLFGGKKKDTQEKQPVPPQDYTENNGETQILMQNVDSNYTDDYNNSSDYQDSDYQEENYDEYQEQSFGDTTYESDSEVQQDDMSTYNENMSQIDESPNEDYTDDTSSYQEDSDEWNFESEDNNMMDNQTNIEEVQTPEVVEEPSFEDEDFSQPIEDDFDSSTSGKSEDEVNDNISDDVLDDTEVDEQQENTQLNLNHPSRNERRRVVPTPTVQTVDEDDDFSAGFGNIPVQQAQNNKPTGVVEVDNSFDSMDLSKAEEAYQQKAMERNTVVKVVEKEVVKEVNRGYNLLASVLKGRQKKTIIVTGDRATGVTSTALALAEVFSKYVKVLYLDCDLVNHGVLSYIDYNAYQSYEDINLQGIRLCHNSRSFKNCVTSLAHNVDFLMSDYSCDATENDLETAQGIVAEHSNDYGVIIVDCPVQYLHCIPDLVMTGVGVICAEGSKRGVMNMLCQFEASTLNTRYKKNLASKGTLLMTKVSKQVDVPKLLKEIQESFASEDVDWFSMRIRAYNGGKLSEKLLNEILEQ